MTDDSNTQMLRRQSLQLYEELKHSKDEKMKMPIVQCVSNSNMNRKTQTEEMCNGKAHKSQSIQLNQECGLIQHERISCSNHQIDEYSAVEKQYFENLHMF
jgi:hypothetical protein